MLCTSIKIASRSKYDITFLATSIIILFAIYTDHISFPDSPVRALSQGCIFTSNFCFSWHLIHFQLCWFLSFLLPVSVLLVLAPDCHQSCVGPGCCTHNCPTRTTDKIKGTGPCKLGLPHSEKNPAYSNMRDISLSYQSSDKYVAQPPAYSNVRDISLTYQSSDKSVAQPPAFSNMRDISLSY